MPLTDEGNLFAMEQLCRTPANTGVTVLPGGQPLTAYGWQLWSHGDDGQTFSLTKPGYLMKGPFDSKATDVLTEAWLADSIEKGRERNPEQTRRFRKPGSMGSGTTKQSTKFCKALLDVVKGARPATKKARPATKKAPGAPGTAGAPGAVPMLRTILPIVRKSSADASKPAPKPASKSAPKPASKSASKPAPAPTVHISDEQLDRILSGDGDLEGLDALDLGHVFQPCEDALGGGCEMA